MRNLIIMSILFFGVPWLAQGQVTEEKVNQMGARGDRYQSASDFQVSDWSVFGDQPQYNRNPEMLSGYGLSTAGELGFTKGWNEMPNNVSVLVELNPNVPVLHLGSQYYLDDCRWYIGGKWVEFKNRFKPINIPLPPSPPAPALVLSDYTPIMLTPLEPYTPFEPGQYVLVLVWEEHGRHWIWKYTPLWCVDVRHPKEVYKPAVCAGVAIGAYALAGGFAGAIGKIPIHTISSP